VTTLVLTGLRPGGDYDVQGAHATGRRLVSVRLGGGLRADSGGVLVP
jgi:hypothetical protein